MTRLESEGEAYVFGQYRLIPSKRLLLAGEEKVELGSRAFDILVLLVRERGKVVSQRQIFDFAWPGLTVDETNLRFQMSQLRRALRHGPVGMAYITNVRGRGYAFVAPVEAPPSPKPPPPVVGSSRRWKLPTAAQPLIGRGQNLATLRSLVPASRLVSIVGAGGVGKTTLAIELAHQIASEFDDDVCYVDLGLLKPADMVLPSVALALGYTAQSDDLLHSLAAYVADRRMLLVLDCCEHVIEAVSEFASTLIRHAPMVHVLATSREPLRADGETVHLLEPLELPAEKPELTAAEALSAASVQLFLRRAAASGDTCELDDENAAAVAQICRQLDGNPLAIELAGSRSVTYGFAGLLGALGGRSILSWPGRRHDPRHRTLQATLDWSFQLLSDTDRRILARLSAFIGTFTMQAAQAVASDAIDDRWTVARAIEELVDKSLIAIRPGGMHQYRMLDVTRFYADIKLGESGEREQVMRRHAQFCVDCLQRANTGPRHLIGAAAPAADSLIGNVRAALEWCFSPQGDIQLGIDLAGHAARMFLARSMLGECLKWCETAMPHLAERAPLSPQMLKLQEALAISLMYTFGNDEHIGQAIKRGLEMATALGERESELHLHAGCNLYRTRRGEFLAALESAERFADLARASQDPAETIAAEWMLGIAHHLIGRERLGQEMLERGFARAKALGTGRIYYFGYDNEGRAMIKRAQTAWLRGMPDKAVDYARQVLDSAHVQGHPVSLCIAYLYTTPVILWVRALSWAQELIEALIQLAMRHSLKPYLYGGLALKGELLLARGQAEEGAMLLQSVIQPLRDERQDIVLTPALRAYAEARARIGQHEEAERMIAELVSDAETGAPTTMLPELIRTQADVILTGGVENALRAQECYQKAIARAQAHGALGWEMRAAISLARLWIEGGQLAKARGLLERTASMFNEGHQSGDLLEAQQLLKRC